MTYRNSVQIMSHVLANVDNAGIDGAQAKKLIPIHTQHDEYHKRMHPNVETVSKHGTYSL